MSESITISLDGPMPSDVGFYFVQACPPQYSDSWAFVQVVCHGGTLMAVHEGGFGRPLEDMVNARWSRRLNIEASHV